MTLSEAALTLVDTPFVHQGRTTNGTDCIGILFLSLILCGYKYNKKDIPAYGREPRGGVLQRELRKHFGEPVVRELRVNDIVAMVHHTGGDIAHVGIITKHPYGLGIVHAYGEIGRVVHTSLDDGRISKIAEVFEWLEKS